MHGDQRYFYPILFWCLVCPPWQWLAPAQAEELPVLRRSFAPTPASPSSFEDQRFHPVAGECLAFIGGTNTADQDRYGYVEAIFHAAWPTLGLKLRNLAWQGDTVHHQARPLHYYTKTGDTQPGSLPDHREKTQAGIILIEFGKLESLDPEHDPEAFMAAYASLLDQWLPLTQRLVLIAPSPFFATGPAAAETNARNERLSILVDSIRQLASDRSLLLVDLFSPFDPMAEVALSDNGTHLNAHGHRMAALQFAAQLKLPIDQAAALRAIESLPTIEAITFKNHLWQQYYRPANWAFLFGDRQHVPASRDHVAREERWLIRELDSLPALLIQADRRIHHQAQALPTQP